ncbi:MAG: type II toxin-antitoxin system VapC family toxin [Bacteroidetes bacterium]|nr:type II toxin-antitoxin system VapC family toxin [Bacteroidota bacterium]
MLVVDTNILAHLLIDGDKTDDARTLFGRDPDWRSDSFVLIEFSNVLATQVRLGMTDAGSAGRYLSEAEKRMPHLVQTPHSIALSIANEFGVTTYDARFLGAARALGTKLVTEDKRLRKAAPELTVSLDDALRGC